MGCSNTLVQRLRDLSGGIRIQEGEALALAEATLGSLSIGDQTPAGEADAACLKPS